MQLLGFKHGLMNETKQLVNKNEHTLFMGLKIIFIIRVTICKRKILYTDFTLHVTLRN